MKAATLSGPTSRIFFSSSAGRRQAEFLRRQVAAELVPVGLQHVVEAGKRQPALAVHGLHAAERCRRPWSSRDSRGARAMKWVRSGLPLSAQ